MKINAVMDELSIGSFLTQILNMGRGRKNLNCLSKLIKIISLSRKNL